MGLKELEGQLIREYQRDPVYANYIGLHPDDRSLGDNDAEAYELSDEIDRGLLNAFSTLDKSLLSSDERLDADMMAEQLRLSRLLSETPIGGLRHYQVCPSGAQDIGAGLEILALNDSLPAKERLDSITGRIKGIPSYLEEEITRLSKVVPRWREIDLYAARALPTFLDWLLLEAESEGYRHMRRLSSAVDAAKAGLSKYARRLRQKQAVRAFARGEAFAESVLKLSGIPLSFNEAYQTAVAGLQERRRIIDEAKVRVCEARGWSRRLSLTEVNMRIRCLYPLDVFDAKALYLKRIEEAGEIARQLGVFPKVDDVPKTLVKTPGFYEHLLPVAAVLGRPVFESNGMRHVLYLTVGSLSSLELLSLALHECVPGHAYHFSRLDEHSSVIRKLSDPVDLYEGFASLVERLADEHLERSPEERLMDMLEFARLEPRVIIDLYLMSGKDKLLKLRGGPDLDYVKGSFQKAEIFLQHYTGFPDARVRSEVGWYSQMPGYPSMYFFGSGMLEELRRDCRAHQGRGYSDRSFIEGLFSEGRMPIKYIRKAFEQKGLVKA